MGLRGKCIIFPHNGGEDDESMKNPNFFDTFAP